MKALEFTVLLAGVLLPAFSQGGKQVAESVLVKNSEIYVQYSGSAGVRQLTSDRTAKGSPGLSKDGKRVAYLGDSPERALGHIVTMLVDATARRDIIFRPTTAKISGMRFVEDLKWISNREIALSPRTACTSPTTTSVASTRRCASRLRWKQGSRQQSGR